MTSLAIDVICHIAPIESSESTHRVPPIRIEPDNNAQGSTTTDAGMSNPGGNRPNSYELQAVALGGPRDVEAVMARSRLRVIAVMSALFVNA